MIRYHNSRTLGFQRHTVISAVISDILFKFLKQGPNYLWSVDGHEKLAQPYGIYIYGVMDTFSRKVLSLRVLPSKTIANVSAWLLQEVQNIGGRAENVMIDKGNEYREIKEVLSVIDMRKKLKLFGDSCKSIQI